MDDRLQGETDRNESKLEMTTVSSRLRVVSFKALEKKIEVVLEQN